MRRIIICIIAFAGVLYFSASLFGQDNCTVNNKPKNKKGINSYTFEFDKEGKLISNELPEYLVGGDSIIFKYPRTEFQSNYKNQYLSILKKSYKVLSDKNNLNKFYRYYPLFQCTYDRNNDSIHFIDDIQNMSENILSAINYIEKELSFAETNEIPAFTKLDTAYLIVNGEKKDSLVINDDHREIKFQLMQPTIDKAKTDWFKNNYNEKIKEINDPKLIERLLKFIHDFDSAYNKLNPDTLDCKEASSLNAMFKQQQSDIEKVLSTDFSDWLMKWIWLNDTNVVFNPLGGAQPLYENEKTFKLADSVTHYRSKVNIINMIIEKQNDIDEIYLRDLEKKFIFATDALQMAIVDSTNKEKAKLERQNIKPNKMLITRMLYDGKLYVSDKSKRNIYMRHHDAATDYELMGKYRPYYLEEDGVKILVQNQVEGKETKLYEFISPTDDNSFVGGILLSGVNALPAALVGTGKSMNNSKTKQEDCNEFVTIEKNRIKFYYLTTRVEWLKKQYLIPGLPTTEDDKSADFRTDIAGPSKPKDAPSLVKYILKEKTIGDSKDTGTVVIDTMSYKVFGLHSIQPFVGFGVGFIKRNELSFNDNQQLTEIKSQINSEAFAGVKIFMKKTDIHSKEWLGARGVNGWSRTTLLVGFDLKTTDPTDSFILGAGLDFLPGLNLSVYGNLYRSTSYKIESGKYIPDGNPYLFDCGAILSIDPIVITRLYKAFPPK